jgi:predicted nucleic acid-binding protein
LLNELLRVLSREKFSRRLTFAGLTAAAIVDGLRRLAMVGSPTPVPRVVLQDPDDDHVLAAALTSGADLAASGDKRDLLRLANYQGVAIVSAREAVDRIEASRSSSVRPNAIPQRLLPLSTRIRA